MFDTLDVAGAQMMIDRVVFSALIAIALVAIVYFAFKKGKQISQWMDAFTNDFSGEDADQMAGGEIDAETRARITSRLKPGDRIATGNSLPASVRLQTASLRDELEAGVDNKRTKAYRYGLRHSLGTEVEYRGHKGGMKKGTAVAYRNQGLHGQVRVSHGSFSVWRSLSKVRKAVPVL